MVELMCEEVRKRWLEGSVDQNRVKCHLRRRDLGLTPELEELGRVRGVIGYR